MVGIPRSSSVILTFIKIYSSIHCYRKLHRNIIIVFILIIISVDNITVISFTYIFKLKYIFVNHKKLRTSNKFIMLEFNIYGIVILC